MSGSSGPDKCVSAESTASSMEKIPLLLDGTFFELNKSSVDLKKNCSAKCMICKDSIRGSIFSTSNFLSHLKLKHVSDYKRWENYKNSKYVPPSKKIKTSSLQQTLPESFKIRGDKDNQKIADKLIADYLVEGCRPFSTTELESFKKLVNGLSKLSTAVYSPSRRHITSGI